MSLLGLNDLQLKLERFCAYQERSLFEADKKLRTLTDNEKIITTVIKALFVRGFLNENRFVDSYVQGKVNQKRWGKKKIKNGLINHKIPTNLINKKLSEISPQVYQKNLLWLAQKKIKTLKKEDRDYYKKTKIMRFLYSKGYTPNDWEGIEFKDLFSS